MAKIVSDGKLEITVRSGYQEISQDSLQCETQMLFQAGLGRQKRTWVLACLRKNQPGQRDCLFSGAAGNSRELFGLAAFFLSACFRSILERARIYYRTQWYRLKKLFQVPNPKTP